jgi:hypothetical protein
MPNRAALSLDPARPVHPVRPVRPAHRVRPARKASKRLSTRELKKLSYDDRSIRALTYLWTPGIFLLAAVIVLGARVEPLERLPLEGQLALALFGAVTVFGCNRRAAWARPCAALLCGLMVLSMTTLGILLGFAGLFVLSRSSKLFGPHRYDGYKLRFHLATRTRYGIR